MRGAIAMLFVTALTGVLVSTAAGSGWTSPVTATNQIASAPVGGGGYPVPPGQTAPDPGTCRAGLYNSNRSESWLAVEPGTEDLVGTSKFFFEDDSTFYNFHLGSYTIESGVPITNNQVQGYDCISTGTQDMPPSWTNNTDPNADFDTQGRVYQATLPFNAFWANLRPNSNIGVVYSDDLGRNWVKGNGGEPLEKTPNWSSLSFGFVEDKQWLAVNRCSACPYRDHVYVAWGLYNGSTAKIRFTASGDRGQTFAKTRTITAPQQTSPLNEYVYLAVDGAGVVYLVIASSSPSAPNDKTIYVARSTDDGATWTPWFPVVDADLIPSCCLPNTTFRDGILEHFAASPDYPGHLYLVWEDWDGTQFDIKLMQSTDGGMTWLPAVTVNDNVDAAGAPTDQFQPQVAVGPGGAVAVAFYDRREACPGDPSIISEDVGRTNFCIDVSLQAFKDTGSGAAKVGSNVRVSQFTWDPEQPAQTINGVDQMACAAHTDPCGLRAFIGDYFGVAISASNVYTLAVSTHYPSTLVGEPTGDGGGPIYYQQQVLGTVSRADLGI